MRGHVFATRSAETSLARALHEKRMTLEQNEVLKKRARLEKTIETNNKRIVGEKSLIRLPYLNNFFLQICEAGLRHK